MKRTLLTVLVGLSLAGSALAEDTELHGKVMDLLNAYEDAPTQADFQALGPGVDAELLTIAGDANVPLSRRGRAVVALGYFPSETNQAFLIATLADTEHPELARKAAHALVTGWPTENAELLAPGLSSEDTQLRIATAKALSRSQDPKAAATLQTRLAVEQNEAVTSALQGSLSTLGEVSP